MTHRRLLGLALLAPLCLLAACGGVPDEERPAPEPEPIIIRPPTWPSPNEHWPRIRQISVRGATALGEPMSLSITLEGMLGEVLSFSLIPDAPGSTFSPAQGSITLEGTLHSFTVQHVPPPVSSRTEFTHTLKVTNSAGLSVLTSFKTWNSPQTVVTNTRLTLSFSDPDHASLADVAAIRMDVQPSGGSSPLYRNLELSRSDSQWTGTLPFLPRSQALTFTAHASNAAGTVLFSGTTEQTLTESNQTVVMTLAPTQR